MLWFSHQQAVTLLGSAGSVLNAVEKERDANTTNWANWSRARAWTILFFMSLWFLFHVSEVIDMHVRFADLQAKYLFSGHTTGCTTMQHVLTRGRMTSPGVVGCSLEIKCFNSSCSPWRELKTLHVLILNGISLWLRINAVNPNNFQ